MTRFGYFWKGLVDKLPYEISPHIWHLRLFWSCHNSGYFLATFGKIRLLFIPRSGHTDHSRLFCESTKTHDQEVAWFESRHCMPVSKNFCYLVMFTNLSVILFTISNLRNNTIFAGICAATNILILLDLHKNVIFS